MNIYDTYFMLAAVKKLAVENTFFKTRYFPTNQTMDVFGTSKVLVDYKDDTSKEMAPFVLPRVGSIPGTRDGFKTYELEPANISVSMPLTIDHLKKRGFGESLFSGLTPEDRAMQFLIADLEKLSKKISRREELLCCETMLDNGTVMRHISDNKDIYVDIPVKFYDGDSNPAAFTPDGPWTHSTLSGATWTRGSWYDDICAMISMLTKHGRPATEIIVAQDVADFLLDDGWILAMLDNRRAEFGTLNPAELGPECYQLGAFNFKGKVMPIICYTATYTDASGNDVPYMPDGSVIITAPGCGKGLYGAVTQLEDDNEFHTFTGTRIPQHISTKRPPVKETVLTSCPLFVPTAPNPWTSAKNVLGE